MLPANPSCPASIAQSCNIPAASADLPVIKRYEFPSRAQTQRVRLGCGSFEWMIVFAFLVPMDLKIVNMNFPFTADDRGPKFQ